MNFKIFNDIIQRSFEVVSTCPMEKFTAYTFTVGTKIYSKAYFYKEIEEMSPANVFLILNELSDELEGVRSKWIIDQITPYIKSKNTINNVIYTDFMKGVK